MTNLLAHDWPGNVREIRNVLERGIVLSSGAVLRPEHIGPLGEAGGGGRRGTRKPLSLEDVERRHIAEVLRQTSGNISQAARVLDIDCATLYAKIRKYDLAARASRSPPATVENRDDPSDSATHRLSSAHTTSWTRVVHILVTLYVESHSDRAMCAAKGRRARD